MDLNTRMRSPHLSHGRGTSNRKTGQLEILSHKRQRWRVCVSSDEHSSSNVCAVQLTRNGNVQPPIETVANSAVEDVSISLQLDKVAPHQFRIPA